MRHGLWLVLTGTGRVLAATLCVGLFVRLFVEVAAPRTRC